MPMVSYDLNHLPEVPAEERKRVAAISDEEIDYSDIPEVRDFSGFVRARGPGSGKEAEPCGNRPGQRCNRVDWGGVLIPH
jgi:hypothetical protein